MMNECFEILSVEILFIIIIIIQGLLKYRHTS